MYRRIILLYSILKINTREKIFWNETLLNLHIYDNPRNLLHEALDMLEDRLLSPFSSAVIKFCYQPIYQHWITYLLYSIILCKKVHMLQEHLKLVLSFNEIHYFCKNSSIPCVPEKRKPVLSVRYLHCRPSFHQTICFLFKGIFPSFIWYQTHDDILMHDWKGTILTHACQNRVAQNNGVELIWPSSD